jgi:hypothetical protein
MEFDSRHSFFARGTNDVEYSTERPVWILGAEHYPAGIERVKSPHWAYEQEVRKIAHVQCNVRKLADGGEFVEVPPDAQPDPDSIHLFDLPAKVITGVIFGWQSDAELQRKIKAAVQMNGLEGVRIRRAIPSRTEFKMEIVKA